MDENEQVDQDEDISKSTSMLAPLVKAPDPPGHLDVPIIEVAGRVWSL